MGKRLGCAQILLKPRGFEAAGAADPSSWPFQAEPNHPRTSPWCFRRCSSPRFPSAGAPTCSLQVKGALDSDTVKGAVRLPGNLGLPGSWVLPEDGHTLFSSADPMENPAESLVTSGKNAWRGFRQRFKGMEGAGNGISSHPFCTPRHSLTTAPSCPARPALSLWIVPGRTRNQSQGRNGVNNAGSGVPSLQHPSPLQLRFGVPPTAKFWGQSRPRTRGGRDKELLWGQNPPGDSSWEHLTWEHLPVILSSPKRQRDPKRCRIPYSSLVPRSDSARKMSFKQIYIEKGL